MEKTKLKKLVSEICNDINGIADVISLTYGDNDLANKLDDIHTKLIRLIKED